MRETRSLSAVKSDVNFTRVRERNEKLKRKTVRFYTVEAGICARYSRKASARILEYERPEDFITHARALFLGSIAHGEEKGGRQAGDGGREKGSRNGKKKREKERKTDIERRGISRTSDRS